jgi:hypothetical protein
MEEQLASLGQGLEAVANDPSVPDEAKAAFQAALEAFKSGFELMAAGGGKPQDPSGPVSPEQGVSNSVPVSHGRPG